MPALTQVWETFAASLSPGIPQTDPALEPPADRVQDSSAFHPLLDPGP